MQRHFFILLFLIIDIIFNQRKQKPLNHQKQKCYFKKGVMCFCCCHLTSGVLAVRLHDTLVPHSFVRAEVRWGTGWESVFLPGLFSLMHQKVLHSSAQKCLIHVSCKSCMCHIWKLLCSSALASLFLSFSFCRRLFSPHRLFFFFAAVLRQTLFILSSSFSPQWNKHIKISITRAETFRPHWIIHICTSFPDPPPGEELLLSKRERKARSCSRVAP